MDPVPSGFHLGRILPFFHCPLSVVGRVDFAREVGKSLADADLKAQRVMSNLDLGSALNDPR